MQTIEPLPLFRSLFLSFVLSLAPVSESPTGQRTSPEDIENADATASSRCCCTGITGGRACLGL